MTEEEKKESNKKLIDDLWCKYADQSDGWETTMDYDGFTKAINQVINK